MNRTTAFIVFNVLGAVAFDFWLHGKSETTLSRRFWQWNEKYASVAFAAGFLCGHLWWPRKEKRRLIKPDPPPRYDEVFEEGVEWLNKYG